MGHLVAFLFCPHCTDLIQKLIQSTNQLNYSSLQVLETRQLSVTTQQVLSKCLGLLVSKKLCLVTDQAHF